MVQADICQRIFNLSFPPTEIELKSAFRSLSKERHPDTGGSHREFIDLKEAYDMLLGYVIEGKKYVDKTTQGDLLVDLGNGLGPTTNGAHCKNCNSLGYRIETRTSHYRIIDCSFCGVRCGRCSGRGRLITGECPECKGSGTFRFRNIGCTFCRGRGNYSKPILTQVYITCSTCEGTGEIKIMNPVLPKGAVR